MLWCARRRDAACIAYVDVCCGALGGEAKRVSTLCWDAENSGLLLGLADFSVVHMRNAADMLRNAIKGLLLRCGNSAAGSEFTCY